MERTLLSPLTMSSSKHRPQLPTLTSPRSSLPTIDTSYYPSSPQTAHYSAHPSRPQPPTEIIPRLYIADLSAAEDSSILRGLRITHVVSAMQGRVCLPNNIHLQHLQIPLCDAPFADLLTYLPRTTDFIARALQDPNARVLVHCALGVSRSASVVCGYLIACGSSAENAVRDVKLRRSQAEPNSGFVGQLHEYANMLRGVSGPSRRR